MNRIRRKKYSSKFKYWLQKMLFTRPERLDRLRYLSYYAQKIGFGIGRVRSKDGVRIRGLNY